MSAVQSACHVQGTIAMLAAPLTTRGQVHSLINIPQTRKARGNHHLHSDGCYFRPTVDILDDVAALEDPVACPRILLQ